MGANKKELSAELTSLEARLTSLRPQGAAFDAESFYFRAGHDLATREIASRSRNWRNATLAAVAAATVLLSLLLAQKTHFDRQIVELRTTASTDSAGQTPSNEIRPKASTGRIRSLAEELSVPTKRNDYLRHRRGLLISLASGVEENTAADTTDEEWRPRKQLDANMLRRTLELELLN